MIRAFPDSDSDIVLSPELQHFLATRFWFDAQHNEYPVTPEVELAGVDPVIKQELRDWMVHIEIGLETDCLGEYKIDIPPYEGLFPIEFDRHHIVFWYDNKAGAWR